LREQEVSGHVERLGQLFGRPSVRAALAALEADDGRAGQPSTFSKRGPGEPTGDAQQSKDGHTVLFCRLVLDN
jgi:hypothetical protein